MPRLDEVEISKTILCTYHEKLLDRIASDVIIVGAGPSGLVAAFCLARSGVKVTVLEKRLSPGGGIWGGGMAMSVAVVQNEAVPLLEEMGIRCQLRRENLYAVDSIELAAGLCWNALQVGVTVLNLMTVEDLCVRQDRVTGVVVNRSGIPAALPVDPIVFSSKAVVDATGHEAVLVQAPPAEHSGRRRRWRRTYERDGGRVLCCRSCGGSLSRALDFRDERLGNPGRPAHGTDLRRHVAVRETGCRSHYRCFGTVTAGRVTCATP